MNNPLVSIIDLSQHGADYEPPVPLTVFVTSGLRHAGIVAFDRRRQSYRFIHLAWEDDLKDAPFHPSRGFLVNPDIEIERGQVIAAYCRKVHDRNRGRLPYSFSQPAGIFDKRTGNFLRRRTRLGLTCSSFVLAIFDACGVPLVSFISWPRNVKSDIDRQKEYIQALKDQGVDSDTIAERSKEIGNPRVAPGEAAALAALSPYPNTFSQLYSKGGAILRSLGFTETEITPKIGSSGSLEPIRC